MTWCPGDHRRGQAENSKDTGPALDGDVPFSQKVAVSNYDSDGYVGSQAVFSDLTFAELPQLANMNSDAAGVNLSLRRNGNIVILEGRADLTSVSDPDADVELTVAFPAAVTSTNGDRIEPEVVQWKLAGRGEHDERTGSLYRSQHPVVHRSRHLAGHRRVRGRRCGGRAGVDRPGPLPRLTASGDPPTS